MATVKIKADAQSKADFSWRQAIRLARRIVGARAFQQFSFPSVARPLSLLRVCVVNARSALIFWKNNSISPTHSVGFLSRSCDIPSPSVPSSYYYCRVASLRPLLLLFLLHCDEGREGGKRS